jgi:hypothetical protein
MTDINTGKIVSDFIGGKEPKLINEISARELKVGDRYVEEGGEVYQVTSVKDNKIFNEENLFSFQLSELY